MLYAKNFAFTSDERLKWRKEKKDGEQRANERK